jgi:hypothetical protein
MLERKPDFVKDSRVPHNPFVLRGGVAWKQLLLFPALKNWPAGKETLKQDEKEAGRGRNAVWVVWSG